LSLGGSSPYTSKNKKKVRINIRKRSKKAVQTTHNTANTSTRITKTPTHYKTHTYTNQHITKQVKTTTVQVKTNRVHDISK